MEMRDIVKYLVVTLAILFVLSVLGTFASWLFALVGIILIPFKVALKLLLTKEVFTLLVIGGVIYYLARKPKHKHHYYQSEYH